MFVYAYALLGTCPIVTVQPTGLKHWWVNK